MGLYGSPWVYIEGIRSHEHYKGFDMPKRDFVCYIGLDLGLDVGWGEILLKTNRKICILWRSFPGVKNLNWIRGNILNPVR